jgi:4-carboxymuconolactone decarboxylase
MRIQPITDKAQLAREHRDVFDQVMDVFGRVRGPFGVMLHSPKLAERVLPLVPFAREGTTIDPKLRQVGVLAAVREREANYVWAAQVDTARRVGLRNEAIDLLRAKGDVAVLAPEERDIANYARKLMRTNRVDQALFDALQARHGVQWLVELTAALNFYVMLCGIANAFEIDVPEGGDRF